MNANRILIVSALGLAVFFIVIRNAEASPGTALYQQLVQTDSSKIVNENLDLKPGASESEEIAPLHLGKQGINSSEPARQQPIVRQAPDVVADLSVSILDGPDPVFLGRSLTYTVTVTNNTTAVTITNVILTDTLPASVSFISATASQGTGCGSPNPLICNLGSIRGGTTARVVILVTPNSTGSITNSATVRSTDPDPDPNIANNSDSETTTVTGSANLAVTLADSPDPINAGANLTYNATVSNAGPDAAVSVVLTHTLPTNVTYQSFSGTGWSCSPTGSLVRCTRAASLASGANTVVGVVVRVNSTLTSGSLTDSVLVRSSTTDPTPGNNTASVATTVQVSADLRVGKVDTVDPAEPGTSIAYTIEVTNMGPSDAVGVRITDTLPVGMSYVIHVPSPEWTCTTVGSQVRCSRAAAVAANNSAQISVVVMIGAGVTGTLNNLVRVGAATPDPVSGNNSDTETTTVIPSSDLSITKVESSDPVIAGTNLTYTLTVSNAGSSNAASLVVTDTLPANVTYQSYGGSSGWTCTLLSGNRLRCTRASLNVSDSRMISILTRVSSGASGSLSNTAVVRSASVDPSLTNNTATVATTVNRRADLSITKTDSPDPLAEGQTLTYRMVVRNNGPSNAASVSLSDPLPTTRVTYVSAVSTQGTCSWSSPNLNCSLGTLVSGNAVTVTVTTTARPVGDDSPKTATNTAAVSTTTTDPNSANNSSTSTTQILPAADLRVNLASLVTTIQTGNPLTYTIEITNNGPSIANNVVVTDTLPAELTFKSSSRTPAVTSPKVVWNLGNLGVGQSFSFTLVVNVNSPTQTLLNSVAVRSATLDVVTANSVDQVSVQAIDSVVPTAAWRLPVAAEGVYIVFNQSVLLEVEAADNVAVSYVRFFRWDSVLNKVVEIGNDTTVGTCQYNPSKLCYQWNLETWVLNPKWNEIRAQAYDASGNYSPDGYRILLKYFTDRLYLPFTRK